MLIARNRIIGVSTDVAKTIGSRNPAVIALMAADATSLIYSSHWSSVVGVEVCHLCGMYWRISSLWNVWIPSRATIDAASAALPRFCSVF